MLLNNLKSKFMFYIYKFIIGVIKRLDRIL